MKIQVKTVLYKVLTLEVEEMETIRDVVQRVQLLEGRDTPYSMEGLVYGGRSCRPPAPWLTTPSLPTPPSTRSSERYEAEASETVWQTSNLESLGFQFLEGKKGKCKVNKHTLFFVFLFYFL
jgi:hypothetical protein